MKSNFPYVFIFVCALVAFLPLVAVDFMLDGYVRGRETERLTREISDVAKSTQSGVLGSFSLMNALLTDSPALCSPTFVAKLRQQMLMTPLLREVIVENNDGVQYCDALGAELKYIRQSADISIPARNETVSIVKFEGQDQPLIKISKPAGDKRRLVAFIPAGPSTIAELPWSLEKASYYKLSLTNGTNVISVGDELEPAIRQNDGSFVYARIITDGVPLSFEAGIPFSELRANYGDLDAGFTVMAGIMGVSFLLMALHYVRRSQMPAFALERAIQQGQLIPYYQPIMDMRTGRLAGCEVLVRWLKRNGDVISPGHFMDYAEATGLAIPMTLRMMQKVRDDLEKLFTEIEPIKIGINLFEGHFRDEGIISDVEAIFGDSTIDLRQLVFEITERRAFTDLNKAKSVIGGLHALGARLAMDDTGTGHSNLAYLQTLGVDIIKIDKVFIDMIKPDSVQVPILDALIALAGDLGADIVAEGIEKPEQAMYLRAHGVFQAQGFLFAPPLKARSFVELARVLNAKPANKAEVSAAKPAEAA